MEQKTLGLAARKLVGSWKTLVGPLKQCIGRNPPPTSPRGSKRQETGFYMRFVVNGHDSEARFHANVGQKNSAKNRR